MRRIRTLICMIAIFNFACTQKVDFLVPEGGARRLVVDGAITNEAKAHQVKLTYTNQFNSSVFPPVENAVVYISDGTNRFLLQESENGIYETTPLVKGEVGKTYTLEISLPDGTTYQAQSSMQAIGSIDVTRYELTTQEVESEEEEGVFEFQEIYAIYGDASILSEYFMLETEINGIKYGTIRDVSYGNSKFFEDGQFIDGLVSIIDISDNSLVSGDNTVKIKMSSIDQNYREFLVGFGAQLNRGDDGLGGLFEGPIANVPGNISNGALGIFGAFAVVEKEIIINQ